MQRSLGVLFGTIIGLALVAGLMKANLAIFPWPRFDPLSLAGWTSAVAATPITAQAMIAGAWAIGTLGGGLIAVRAANWAAAGWIVTLLIVLIGGVAILLIPQPLWMQVATVAAPLAAGLVVYGASGAA